MKILHVLPHARDLGGSERTVLDLVRSPLLRDFRQRVAFVQPGNALGFAPTEVIGGSLSRRVPGLCLPEAIRWRPDIVHGWLLQGNGLAALIKLVRPSVGLVTSERNVGHLMTPGKRRLESLIARLEDVATANSEAVRDAAVARHPSRIGAFRVIYPGVAPLPRPADTSRATVVMVGRLHPVKDYDTALRAWQRVQAAKPGTTLSIVGDGTERPRLAARAAALGLASTVRFRGAGDPAPDLYGAHVFLSTSRSEGFSRALVEALGAGLPVVSTDVGGASELRGPAVRVAPVGDDKAVAGHLIRLIAAPEERRAARAAALALADRFAPDRCHAAFAALYREAARRAPGQT